MRVLLCASMMISFLGGWGETQRFREVPKSVLVSENDSVELRCAVEHQKGKAQWTKDGFALGFERDVPGYPRYQYSGDISRGEHHLVITGVTLQDDGEYQCQVGPTNEAPPIWAGANVTVLVSPSSISIVGWGDGAVVEVVSGSSLALECLVSDARPAPSLTWYRDGIELDFSKQRDITEKGSRPRLMSLRSRLHVKAVPADDGQQFSCRGNHPALERVPSALVASITLSVLHPPEAPKITGYNEGDVIASGEKISLTCTSQGGNPRPWVFWYRANHLIDDTTTTDEKTVINVLDLQATSSEDGAVFECRVTSDMLATPLTTNLRVSVHYPPSSVTINGPKSVAIGDDLSLQCTTNPSNPQARIKWVIQGKEVKTGPSASTKDPSGGWVTSSTLSSYKVTSFKVKEGSQIETVCEAINPEVKEVVSSKHIITLVKPAGPPILEELSGEIVSGVQLAFSCLSKGGNPPPTITLYKGGELLSSEVKQVEEGTKVFAEVRVKPEDNGKEVTCQVNHPATKEPRSLTQRLTVLFPPFKIVGRAAPSAVEEGNHVTLSCESSSSNPPANITWYSEGSILKGASQHLTDGEYKGKGTRSELVVRTKAEDDGRIFNCEASNGLLPVASTNITVSVSHAPVWVIRPPYHIDVYETEDLVVSATAAANPGPLRYWWRRDKDTLPATGGEFRLAQIRREETGNYSVSAYSPRGAVNATFFINVQYPPEKVTAPKKVVVGEGATATSECSAEGNPNPKVMWLRRNQEEPLATGIRVSQLLLQNVSRNETGIYVCSAVNGVGTPVVIETKIIVTHGAVIVREAAGASGSWAIEGRNGLLVCHARASPTPTFYWSTHDGETFQSNEKYKLQDSQLVDGLTLWVSALEIVEVNSRDYTEYRCTASNALGADTTLMTLKPPNKPLPPSALQLINKTVSSITISWAPSRLEGGPIHSYIVRYRDEINISFQEIKTSSQETTTTLFKLQPGKTYVVTVYATNDKGSSSLVEPPLLVTLPASELPGEMISGSSTNFGSNKRSDRGVIIGGWRVPRLVVLITTLTGATLLVLNIAIISCFVKRRNNARNIAVSSSKTTALAETAGANLGSNESCNASQENGQNANVSSSQVSKPTTHSNNSTQPGLPLTNLQVTPPPNGHLPRKNSLSVSSLSVARSAESGLLESSHHESSYSVDLLQGSVSPEGRRAAAVNPEVCSLASSTYECQKKRTSAPTSHQEDAKPCAAEDRVSLASYHIEHSRSYSYGQIRPMQLHHPQSNMGVREASNRQYINPHHTQHILCQNKLKEDQESLKLRQQTENVGQYASLNAANLCELGASYYESRCCQGHNSTACRCNTSGSGPVLGYATLGSTNRKLKTPHFATLQRNRPSEIRFQSCSFDVPVSPQCHSGCPAGCHCHEKIMYSKVTSYSSPQPCSLPTCLPSSSSSSSHEHQRKNSLNGTPYAQHSSSQKDISGLPKEGVRKENIVTKDAYPEIKRNMTASAGDRDPVSTLRKKKDQSLSLLSPSKNESSNLKSKVQSPNPKQKLCDHSGKEPQADSIPIKSSKGVDLTLLSPRYCQPLPNEKYGNISSGMAYLSCNDSADSNYTSIASAVTTGKQKFSHDVVKQQNGSTKDPLALGTLKSNSKRSLTVNVDEINSKR